MPTLPPDPTGLTALLGDPEVRRMVGDLVAKKLRADLTAIRGGAELMGRWQAGGGNGDGAARAGTGPGEGVVGDLVRLHLEYYTALVDMTSEFHERTRALLGADAQPPAGPPPAPDPEMRLRAAPGGVARSGFRVENTTAAPLTVELVATPFVRDGSDRLLTATVAFDPPRLELTPGQEAQVAAIVEVGADAAPGATYRATISASGVEAVRIGIRLEVEEAPAPTGKAAPGRPAGKKPAPKKTTAKKTAAKKTAAPRRKAATRASGASAPGAAEREG